MKYDQPAPSCQLDDLDLAILDALRRDGRRPYLDIARQLRVAGGTVHQRLERLRQAGLVLGTRLVLARRPLGLDVTVLVGIHLTNAKAIHGVLARLEEMPEVLRASYTTGNYSLIIEVCVASIEAFHRFLIDKLQAIDEIRATESFVCLDVPIDRELPLPAPTTPTSRASEAEAALLRARRAPDPSPRRRPASR
jgi:Lrp/AsnC family transcriptional regulator for asnA, asnC and gidA